MCQEPAKKIVDPLPPVLAPVPGRVPGRVPGPGTSPVRVGGSSGRREQCRGRTGLQTLSLDPANSSAHAVRDVHNDRVGIDLALQH